MSAVETGPVRFGDDWAGVFIRGDQAAAFTLDLARLMSMAEGDGGIEDALVMASVGNLLDLMRSCRGSNNIRRLPEPEDP